MMVNKSHLFLGHIIFDLDGTLIDSMNQHREIFGKMLYKGFRVPQNVSEEIYAGTAGKPLDEQFQIVLQQFGIHDVNIIQLVDEFWSLVEEIRFLPFSDVPLAIKILHDAGYALFITSGSTSTIIKSKLANTGIQNYFQLILGSDYSTTANKKGADHFRKIQRHLELTTDVFRQSTIFVGDAKHDMQLAKEEGIVGILRIDKETPKDIEADLYINDLTEFISYLKGGNFQTGIFMRIAQIRRN